MKKRAKTRGPQEHVADLDDEAPRVPDYHAVGPTSGPPGQVAATLATPRGQVPVDVGALFA